MFLSFFKHVIITYIYAYVLNSQNFKFIIMKITRDLILYFDTPEALNVNTS